MKYPQPLASARVPNRGRQQRQAAIAAPNAADVLRGNVQQRREEGAAAHLALVASVTDASAALAVAQEGEASVKIAHAQWRTKIGVYFHFCSDFYSEFLPFLFRYFTCFYTCLYYYFLGPLTVPEFKAHALAAVKPGYDYFAALYLAEGGKLRTQFLALRGASLLDPFKVKEMAVPGMKLLVGDLKHFGFPEFTPEFLANVKGELPKYLRQACAPFDWGDVEGAPEYSRALANKQR